MSERVKVCAMQCTGDLSVPIFTWFPAVGWIKTNLYCIVLYSIWAAIRQQMTPTCNTSGYELGLIMDGWMDGWSEVCISSSSFYYIKICSGQNSVTQDPLIRCLCSPSYSYMTFQSLDISLCGWVALKLSVQTELLLIMCECMYHVPVLKVWALTSWWPEWKKNSTVILFFPWIDLNSKYALTNLFQLKETQMLKTQIQLLELRGFIAPSASKWHTWGLIGA